MPDPTDEGPLRPRVRCGIVLSVQEDSCQIYWQGRISDVRFATFFPSPRTERVSPGHLVAVTTSPAGAEVVVWRWYDGVVVAEEAGLIRMWEPAHGRVLARPRRTEQPPRLGTRAYLSAGLPGAEWWVAGAVASNAEEADVELEEVERFLTDGDLWDRLG